MIDLLRGTVARGEDSPSDVEVQTIDTIAQGKAYEDTHKAVGEEVRSDIHTAVDDPGDQKREYHREASVSESQAEEGSHRGIVRRVPREEAIELPVVAIDIVQALLQPRRMRGTQTLKEGLRQRRA